MWDGDEAGRGRDPSIVEDGPGCEWGSIGGRGNGKSWAEMKDAIVGG
jgi:hypothetical protein